jgi:hypothetical protein
MYICKPKLSAYLLCIYTSRTAQSEVKECARFVTQKSFTCLRSFFYAHLISNSLCTHLAQTPLISMYSVRMLNTNDMLIPHMDPTSLNLRLLCWCHEYGILRYPYLTDVFQISQRNIYITKCILKIMYTTCKPMISTLSNISLIPPSFLFSSQSAFSQAERRNYMWINSTLSHAHCRRHFTGAF